MVKADDLIREQKKRNKLKEKIYKKIYKRIEKKIKLCSNINSYECWYEIPEFILNLPLYSLDDCMKYVVNQLKKDGFIVTILNEKIL